MRQWTGREAYRNLGEEEAIAKYKDRIITKANGVFGSMGRNILINLMREELLNHYRIDEERLQEIDKELGRV